MDIRRVALVYDGTHRPETTGFYCRRALGTLAEVEHFEPGELARIPEGFDLYVNVDDGMAYNWPARLRPSAWWAIDTHLDFDRCLGKSRRFDLVFAAQKDGAEGLRRAGIATASWLPLACDPEIHRRIELPPRYEVAFVGNVFPGPREELLELLRRKYREHFIGNAYFEEMASVYGASRAVFNRSLNGDVNMRVFEALGCGGFLMTDRLDGNGLPEHFRDGVHLAAYDGAEDLLDRLDFYLARGPLRARIAAAGHAEALERHTYRHRMERLLREAEAAFGSVSVSPGVASVGAGPGRDGSYFRHARPELLAMVPESARRVLDIGCGEGMLGAAIKDRQGAEVVGLERDPVAAESARSRLDAVIAGDAESVEPGFEAETFDAIVCGDVLEHLREPGALLARARRWLRPEGRLVASIPNVRHHSVIRSLLRGNWTYESAGLLDADHVRFFTRREIEKLFFRAGFELEAMGYVVGPEDGDGPPPGAKAGEVRIGGLHVGGLAPEEAEEFHAYQYILRARPASDPEFGLTSIVILTHNELEYTRLCLESIRRLTDEPFELIMVDNGSTDGTPEYLATLAGVRLIRNVENRGFPAAANQGITAATGDQILLLNNDTVVTTGWLRRMLRALGGHPSIGLVGPCSNRVSGFQEVEADYESLADLDGFAWDHGRANEGRVEDVDRLIGFCLLIRREVIEAIGLLDERFGVGCFEDDDFCRRAIAAGFQAVVARDSFVHHFGSRTFLGSGIDFAGILQENEAKYRAKWSEVADREVGGEMTDSPRPESIGSFRLAVAEGGGLLLHRERVELSLCMIVRDNARTLPACLESIRPWVDEMVIVDTGSVDETPAIVTSYGGRLFHFPWCDDFSAARNESLRHARGGWIFWMDSDDTIPADCGRGMRAIALGNADPRVLAYVMQVHCPGGSSDGPGADVTVVDHVKLFRNRPDLRFEGRIHEQILPAVRRAGGEVAWTDHFVVHSGSDPGPEAQARKRTRDMRILEQELKENPGHPFVLFNLGMTLADKSDFAAAADYLRRSIAVSGDEESHLRKAYSLLLYAEMRLNRWEEALGTCRRGRGLFPDDVELRFREGVLLHDLGRHEDAERAYRDVLGNREARHFSSLDPGITGFKTRQNLAAVLQDMGRHVEAEDEWRRIVAERPAYRPGWRGLVDALLRDGRLDEADQLLDAMDGEACLRVESLILRSRLALTAGETSAGVEWMERALEEDGDDLEAIRWECRVRFEHGESEEAEKALRTLIAREPEDASAHHNLGTILLAAGRFEESAEAYRLSLYHRPDHEPTMLQLAAALRGCGNRETTPS